MIRWSSLALGILTVLLSAYGRAETLSCPQSYDPALKREVLDLMKANLSALNGLELKVDGPNCWNAGLISTGILKSTRHVTNAEFWFWLNSDYCRALNPNEEPATGDIGSLFWKHKANFHSFIRIDDDTVFSKNSPDASDKYELQSYENMFFENYRAMASSCKGSEESLRKKNCEFAVVYHRCRPVDGDFFTRVAAVREMSKRIDRIEERLARSVRNPEALSVQEFSALIESLGAHLDQIRSFSLRGKDEFVRKALEFRIIGLLFTDLNEKTYSVSQMARAALFKADEIAAKEKTKSPQMPERVQRGH